MYIMKEFSFIVFLVALNYSSANFVWNSFRLQNVISQRASIDYDVKNVITTVTDGIKHSCSLPNFQKGWISETKCQEYISDLEKKEWASHSEKLELSSSSQSKCQKNQPMQMSKIRVVDSRIKAKIAEFPHMGAVGWETKHQWVFLCSSFLISDYFLLTAAHCYDAKDNHEVADPLPKIVRLGVEDIMDETRSKDFKIDKFIQHPKYKPSQKYYDIALIKLTEQVQFDNYIRPACLCSHDPGDLKSAMVTGWGIIEKGITTSKKETFANLMMVEEDLVETEKCNWNLRQKIDKNVWNGTQDHQICATNLKNQPDICNGDSGDPLQVKMATGTAMPMYNVVGVVSFGTKCGYRKFPSVCSKIVFFIDWIEKEVWGEK